MEIAGTADDMNVSSDSEANLDLASNAKLAKFEQSANAAFPRTSRLKGKMMVAIEDDRNASSSTRLRREFGANLTANACLIPEKADLPIISTLSGTMTKLFCGNQRTSCVREKL
jgi:hypothetical protein